jgi:hypothetical protein
MPVIRGQILDATAQVPLGNLGVEVLFVTGNRVLLSEQRGSSGKGTFEVDFPEAILVNVDKPVRVTFRVTRGNELLAFTGGDIDELEPRDYNVRLLVGEGRRGRYDIVGELLNLETREFLPGLQIEASYLLNGRQVILKQSATSDDKGAFRLEFSKELFANVRPNDVIAVNFQVSREGRVLPSEGSIPVLEMKSFQVSITVRVSEGRDDEKTFRVEGTITDIDGRPVAGVIVEAFDRDMRHEEPLGSSRTDANGSYNITYTQRQFRRAEKGHADLLIRVRDENGDEIGVSGVVYNADIVQIIDLTLENDSRARLSEYERHVRELAPLIENVPLAELTDDDLGFLTGETGISSGHLRFLQLDAQWSNEHDVHRAVFYGLFRQGLASSYHRLLSEKPSRLREALKASIEAHVVPVDVGDDLDEILQRLEELAIAAAFEQDEEAETPRLGVLLSTAPDLSLDQQTQAVRFARTHYESSVDDFWSGLSEQTGLSDEAIASVRFTIQSSPLLFSHLPTLHAIQQHRQEAAWSAASDLARLSREDWHALSEATTANELPVGFDDPGQFADAIMHRVEQTFPTAVVAYRLAEDTQLGSSDLNRFFGANTGFDLLRTRIDDYFENGVDLEGVADREALRDRVKEVQRAARIVPRNATDAAPEGGFYNGVRALLTHGFTSSHAVVNRGRADFMSTMTPIVGKAASAQMFEGAMARARLSEIALLNLRDRVDSPAVLRDFRIEDIPVEWRSFFGTSGTCACPHCRSVYSPAAYLVDLLKFLDDAPDTVSAGSDAATRPLDVLLERRPDLQHILLNCANATTPLPYIDLVNEILEDAVAAEAPTARQTSEPATALRARPQHENTAAYGPLRVAEYPWTLPFNPDQERVWQFAEHLGVELDEVRSLFDRDQGHIAKDSLRMSQSEWDLLARPFADVDVSGIWGIRRVEDLADARRFMQHADLSYEELQELVGSWFLSTDGLADVSLELSDADEADPCDIADYRLRGLADDSGDMGRVLDQVHRLLRLRRKLGWSITDLDSVLSAFGHSEIGGAVVQNVARMQRLAGMYRVPVQEVVGGTLESVLRAGDQEIELFAALNGRGDATSLGLDDRLSIMEDWQVLRASGFNLRELAYILVGWDQSPPVFTPEDAASRSFLRALHAFARAASDTGTLSDSETSDLIVENLARYLSLTPEVVGRLVRPVLDAEGGVIAEALLDAQGGSAEPAIADLEHFLRIDAVGMEPDEADPATYLAARLLMIRLDRLARLLRQLDIDADALEAISRTRAINGFLDFNRISTDREPPVPLPDRDAAARIFAGWKALVDASRVERSLPSSDLDLFDFLQEAAGGKYTDADLTNADTFADLAAHTGWRSADIAALTGALGLDASSFQQAVTYRRLHQAMQWLRRWRVSPETLIQWGDPERSVEDLAHSLYQTARSRYESDERWYEILTPISDRLREKKRDALLSYLIHHTATFDRPADVYAHYLIDVEMSSCQLTSRIKQANASIQLFIQRILMNLENEARLTDVDATHWQYLEWMHNYRVWEANRKVFLYPENWIEPDLRDDKSVFFKELENELLQDEVSDPTAERAYRHFLEKLDDVAHLDARGIYHEVESEAVMLGGFIRFRTIKSVLHVFARTKSAPHKYYYRRRDIVSGFWTGWEEINVNIESDHLTPVVHNDRLLLFWTNFEVRAGGYDVFIHWSEYRHGQWESRRTHRLTEPIVRLEVGMSSARFLLRPHVSDGELQLTLFFSDDAIDPYQVARFSYDDCQGNLKLDRNLAEVQMLLLPRGMASEDGGLVAELRSATPATRAVSMLVSVPRDDALHVPRLADVWEDAVLERREFREHFLDNLRAGIDLYGELRRRSADQNLLNTVPREYRLVPSHQDRQVTLHRPFILDADGQSYLATPADFGMFYMFGHPRGPRFEVFSHPFLCSFIRAFNRAGIPGLLSPPFGNPLDRQLLTESVPTAFSQLGPESIPTPWPVASVDFAIDGSNALYNWELFFHIPLLIAERLNDNGRFEDAHRWFHYIFDPTDVSFHNAPERYWKVKPFFLEARNPPQTIHDLMRQLSEGDEAMWTQVEAWRNDPFNPHLIARLRPRAYMKSVVMKYLDHLIAWGDHLFQQDTIESINEASQLYVQAATLLGERTPTIEGSDTRALDFDTLRVSLDEFANALIDLETELPADLGGVGTTSERLRSDLILYFCIPYNEKLNTYWDTIADRLFKIRNCMNLEGQTRQLPLFEPPIDPALLVRARAAGLDLRQVLNQAGSVNLSHYRYAYLQPRALELCNDVRALGQALLATLEKKDAEDLSLMRTRHEGVLLSQIRRIKDQQIREAEETLEGLKNNRRIAEQRREYYDGREFRNSSEEAQIDDLQIAHNFGVAAQSVKIAASILHLVPDIIAGAGGGTKFGGSHLGHATDAAAGILGLLAGQYAFEANLSSIQGGYERRRDDWTFQAELASTELDQIDRQIAAAEIRLAIAEQDLANHERQIEQNREVESFLRRKFTNLELYGWMVSQLSGLHFQAYRMAYDLARKAERAARHELGIPESESGRFSFINFGHWDGLKKGLLAGEKLNQELRGMDVAYAEQNRRDFEITRHISLATINPAQLIQLRETGACRIHIPEILFDMDFPGQYRRRIKSVSITIPCVTGPYTNVSAKLTLESSRYRHTIGGTTAADYAYAPSGVEGDSRFAEDVIGQQSIATSTAQGDSGLFEFSFRDERYLPFEGAGAISNWRLEFPSSIPQFDYDTISDAVIHLSYTATDDQSLVPVVREYVQDEINSWLENVGASGRGFFQMISLRQEFSSHLHRFLHPEADEESHETRLSIRDRHFPRFLRDYLHDDRVTVREMNVIVKPRERGHRILFDGHPILFARDPLSPGTDLSGEVLTVDTAEPDPIWGGLPAASFSAVSGSPAGEWILRIDPDRLHPDISVDAGGQPRLSPDAVDDIILIMRYEISAAT